MDQLVLGRVEIVGQVHGAMNARVVVFENPDDWYFKQFVSEEQLSEFLSENHFVLKEKQE
jgi:hypothetical protein